jgi:hypothetical protein
MPVRRSADRRVRQVYHDLDPRSGSRRPVAVREAPPREVRDGPGLFTWAVIALVALFMADALVWHGQYRHKLWVSINAEAASLRVWVDSPWHA